MIEVIDNSMPLPSLVANRGSSKVTTVAQANLSGPPSIRRKARKIKASLAHGASPLSHFVQVMHKTKGVSPATLFKPQLSPMTQVLVDLRQAKAALQQACTAIPPSAQVAAVTDSSTTPSITSIHQAKPVIEGVQSQYRDLRHRIQIDEAEAHKQFNDARVAAANVAAGSAKKERGKKVAKEITETEDIFVRFEKIALKLVDQSESEANDLYSKIKTRTDDVDFLNRILGKINVSGELDLSKDEKAIDQLRRLGVEIPAGKNKWNEEEKKLLKETIHGAKDGIEKFSQLERIKLQRVMQNVAHHLQAISNVHRLLRQIMDTIIHNMGRG